MSRTTTPHTSLPPLSEPLYKALAHSSLLSYCDPETFTLIDDEASWLSLPGGRFLFRKGDAAAGLYILISGEAVVIDDDSGDVERIVARLGPGSTIGEMGLIGRRPRLFSILAERDCELLYFDAALYESIYHRNPKIAIAMAELITDRLYVMAKPISLRPPKTFALIGLCRPHIFRNFIADLHDAISKLNLRVHILTDADAERDNAYFHSLEWCWDVIIYTCTDADTSWTRLCLRQADHALFVTRGKPRQQAFYAVWGAIGHDLLRHKRKTLVMLSSRNASVAPMMMLSARQLGIDVFRHIRDHNQHDVARLARLITQNGIGLVLSSGGARGFAHLGAARALTEAGIHFDIIGGCSMGAIIGAGLAHEHSFEELREALHKTFCGINPMGDYTIPLVALSRGRRAQALLRRNFQSLRIEQLWRPYFCISSNLSTQLPYIHRTGPLWRALAASCAVPGIVPPLDFDGELLCDGSTYNNLPTDFMDRELPGRIIAIQASSHTTIFEPNEAYHNHPFTNLITRRYPFPTLLHTLARVGSQDNAIRARQENLADIVFRLDTKAFSWFDWNRLDDLIDRGYQSTLTKLEQLDAEGRLNRFITPAAA